MSLFDGLVFPVAGHRAGLPCKTDLKNRLKEKATSSHIKKSLELTQAWLLQVVPLLKKLLRHVAGHSSSTSESEQVADTELFLRMGVTIAALPPRGMFASKASTTS
jgi:hypothetical protein